MSTPRLEVCCASVSFPSTAVVQELPRKVTFDKFCAHQLSISKFNTTYMVCGICTVQFSYVEKTRKSESSSPDARPIIFHYLEKCLILIGYVMSSHASRSYERIARQTATRSPFRQDADQKSVIPQRGGVRLRFSFPLRRLRFANQRRKSY